MDVRGIEALLCLVLMLPLHGSIGLQSEFHEAQILEEGQVTRVPGQTPVSWADPGPWWGRTALDSDRNGIHDSIQEASGMVNVGLSYGRAVTETDRISLGLLGHEIHLELPVVDALLIGAIDASEVSLLAQLDDVVMVERYGSLVFYGDIQTPAVKARNSTDYPIGAWDLGVSGQGVNIALTDTGVDNEHPGSIE